MPLLKRAREAAEKDNDARYATIDAVKTKNILQSFVDQCEKDKAPIESANDNMDEAFKVVAKALVDQHMMLEENGKMEEIGDGKDGKENHRPPTTPVRPPAPRPKNGEIREREIGTGTQCRAKR